MKRRILRRQIEYVVYGLIITLAILGVGFAETNSFGGSAICIILEIAMMYVETKWGSR